VIGIELIMDGGNSANEKDLTDQEEEEKRDEKRIENKSFFLKEKGIVKAAEGEEKKRGRREATGTRVPLFSSPERFVK